MTKEETRNMIKQQFLEHSPEELLSMSDNICKQLASHPSIAKAKCVLAFYPLKDEVDIRPFLEYCTSKDKTVLLPEVTSETDMVLREYRKDAALKKGVLGTTIPQANEYKKYDDIDVVIVPGVAFDNDGHRMGRGRGYYDRFLPKLRNAIKLGVCYHFQYKDTIACEPHDSVMDEVLY